MIFALLNDFVWVFDGKKLVEPLSQTWYKSKAMSGCRNKRSILMEHFGSYKTVLGISAVELRGGGKFSFRGHPKSMAIVL